MDTQIHDSENDSFSHEELMKLTVSTLSKLLPNDPVLRDLPNEVTLEEVNAQVALQFGRSMTVYVVRGDGEELPIVVSNAVLFFIFPCGLCKINNIKSYYIFFLFVGSTRDSYSSGFKTCFEALHDTALHATEELSEIKLAPYLAHTLAFFRISTFKR